MKIIVHIAKIHAIRTALTAVRCCSSGVEHHIGNDVFQPHIIQKNHNITIGRLYDSHLKLMVVKPLLCLLSGIFNRTAFSVKLAIFIISILRHFQITDRIYLWRSRPSISGRTINTYRFLSCRLIYSQALA